MGRNGSKAFTSRRSSLRDDDILEVASNLEKQPEEGFGVENVRQTRSNGLKTFIPRRRSLMPDWPDDVQFDEKEQVVTQDAEGNYEFISDSIQPYDVWHADGVKYFVTFNEFFQPLKKGGHVLIKFIGDVAKTERFCPIRETNWHHVNAKYKADIIKLIRAHFVIPDSDAYNQGIIKRIGRSVRQYRHYLKKTYFRPVTKSKEQVYESGPSGHPRDSWMHLVDYWYSEKGKRFSECGKEARASQNHVHTTGSTSYANIRADFEEKNGREASELEIFGRTHRSKDGSFVKDTITEEFMIDVDAEVHAQINMDSSNTKSRVEIENESFNKLMYGDADPKRPLGYGFGVKRSDIFGVSVVLRKEDVKYTENNSLALRNMEKVVADLKEENKKVVANLKEENKELAKKHEELQINYDKNNQLLNKVTSQFGQILDVLNSGNAPTGFFEVAKTILRTSNQQVPDFTNGHS